MILKLGMKHQGMEFYKVCINHDHVMTLTYFTARSTQVAYAFEWGKIVLLSFEGKTVRKWANGLKSYDSEKLWTPRVGLRSSRGNIQVYHYKL